MMHLLCCPACGPLGIRARRRNRRAADAALVRFHSQLAAEVRAERAAARREAWAALFAPTVSTRTDPMRELIARAGVVALHSHTADEPCDDTCSVYERANA
ncbi:MULTISPECIES: hypothetical protein [Mycolicibacterium]|uniref:Uncharacterized protein n=2 Tax=Mycolicibacterium TaxID=1866885 RepID=A0AAE5ADR8_MYCFO|nr:hypothetical protein [Mycolicibacterium fortuitum]MDV7192562.1 hypothetical protein [Mycolicibacterium fortuitum]MDV7205463.1 hypothetical protein [Mycolicibacterium fortuitum]MDV7227044.1 hypothetical protein [Mycolicibacterium fortuitum]MDV7259711.1 hypothetical protein [Mycolicibacterium fortuitum]MDV7286274.1 hypothetical protein [Mycolicibacterium fortuitum]